MEWGKQSIGKGDRSSRHQRECSAEPLGQGRKLPGQRRRNDDRIRCFGKIEKCSIDIEEECPLFRMVRESIESGIVRYRIGFTLFGLIEVGHAVYLCQV